MQLWSLLLPELFEQVELDLRIHNLITDLDADLRGRSWHFIRAAILRLMDIDGTWVRKVALNEHV